MRRFLVWLAVTVAVFAGVSVPYHLYLRDNPRRVVVAVDTSYSMEADGAQVRTDLQRLGALRYARFSLLTDKVRVHGWQDELQADKALSFYGPQDLSALADRGRYPELSEADEVYVLTNAADVGALRSLPGLRVVREP